jgi:hypothetical protein
MISQGKTSLFGLGFLGRMEERGESSPLKADIMLVFSLSILFSTIVRCHEGASRHLVSAVWFSTLRRKLGDFMKHHRPISLRKESIRRHISHL